jgi:hypothetical protein
MVTENEFETAEDVFFTIQERGPITEKDLRRIHPEYPIGECTAFLEREKKAKNIDAGWITCNDLPKYIGSWIVDNEPVAVEVVKDTFDLDFREYDRVCDRIMVSKHEVYEHDDVWTSEPPWEVEEVAESVREGATAHKVVNEDNYHSLSDF